MPSLYEINYEIKHFYENLEVDEDTGELLADADELAERFEELLGKKQDKLENIAKVILNLRAEAESLAREEKRLTARRKKIENHAERLLEILDIECDGQKTNLGVATVSYRKTDSVCVIHQEETAKWLLDNGYKECVRFKPPEVSKVEVRKLLEDGVEVPNTRIIEHDNCSLR